MVSSLLPALVFLGCTKAAAEVYSVAAPNLRSTCTERCSSMESATDWRCDNVVDAEGASSQVCNTLDTPDGEDHTCHYHFYSSSEVGQCLNDNSMDVIFLGASYTQGLYSTVFPWFDKSIQQDETLDVVDWLGRLDAGFTQDSLGTYYLSNLVSGQENINAQGEIVWKGGASFGSYYGDATPYSAVQEAASSSNSTSGTSALTFINARSFSDANVAMDALAAAGRSERKAYLVISIGAWWYYCWAFKGSYCTAFDEGSEVSALGSDWDAVQSNLEGYFTTFLDRIQADFPNYVIVTSDYAFDWSSSPALEPLSTMLKEFGEQYGYFLDIYALTHGANAPQEVGGHPLHQTNMAAWQRVLSVACKDLTPAAGAQVECEEEVVMSSTCQYNTALETAGPASEALSWSYQWMRPCDFVTYQSFTATESTGGDNGGSGGNGGSSSGSGGSGSSVSPAIIAVAACVGLLVVGGAGFCIAKRRRSSKPAQGSKGVDTEAGVPSEANVVVAPLHSVAA